MKDIICFEVNNWTPGEDFPTEEPFLSWMADDLNLQFHDNAWVKEQKICVLEAVVDMSISFLVTAPKKWVEENCPCLLKEEWRKFIIEYPEPYCNEYNLNRTDYAVEERAELKKEFEENKEKLLKDLQTSDLVGYPSDQRFLNYTKENIGLWWYDDIEGRRKRYDEE